MERLNHLSITDAVKKFGITSKTLRYYEKVGLLEAKRTASNNYRSYTESESKRIEQIIILRKMQIPIKDIIRIYESEEMSVVVDTFVNRIAVINDEIDALTKLRNITDDFLQLMIQRGITKISALPILYEKMEEQLSTVEQNKKDPYNDLSVLSDKLQKPFDISIINLPQMRVLSSQLKENLAISDADGFWHWIQANELPLGEPGMHEQFEYQTNDNNILILRVAEDFINGSPYHDDQFEGGLFATTHIYLDEDVNERFHATISAFDDNKFYEIDYQHNGKLRHEALIETLISPDDKRELISLFIPVKKRFADSIYFDGGMIAGSITLAELEKQNPILWSKQADFSTLTPRENSTLTLLHTGEAEFKQYIWPGVLPTKIDVQIPFRVDIKFRTEFSSLQIVHDKALLRINDGLRNDRQDSLHSITFDQPIFGDRQIGGRHTLNHIGAIIPNAMNTVTWLVGEKHFACIINGEMRYCQTEMPYMQLNPKIHTPSEIEVGSDQGDRHLIFESITISQLVKTKKNKLKKGDLTMITKQSNNILPDLHHLITWHYGENYVINGCMRLLMERVKPDEPINSDYNLFAAITADNETQTYGRGFKRSYNEHDLPLSSLWDGPDLIAYLFEELGYEHTYVTAAQIRENKGMFIETVKAYIDKGIPVLARTAVPAAHGTNYELVVGYEENGKVLIYLDGDDQVFLHNEIVGEPKGEKWPVEWDWIFIGDKKRDIDKRTLYINCLKRTLEMLTSPDKYGCSYGAKAFRDWADDIENGHFENGGEYTTYVCVLATNGGRGFGYIYSQLGEEQMPEFSFLKDILDNQCAKNNALWGELEALGGGFNVTNEVMQDVAKRKEIADKVREFAVCKDEIVEILRENLKEL